MNSPRPGDGAEAPLRLLLLEDHVPDAELLLAELRRAGFLLEPTRIASRAEFQACLEESWDLILADFALPQFDALKALEALRSRGLQTPFIVVTGAVSEEVAVECIKQGAADYLLKDRLIRLPSAVRQALEQRRMCEESARAHAALRENERRLRALIEHSSGGILLLDASGRITHRYNDLFSETENWYPDTFLEWMLPEDQAKAREAWERLGGAGESAGIQTIDIRVSNGQTTRYLEVVLNDLHATPGVGAIVAHYRDVTESQQMEDQYRHAQKMEAVGQLAAGLGHDFNNLLTIIIGYGEALTRRSDLPESAYTAANEILDACQRAAALTRELLTFSRRRERKLQSLDVNREISALSLLLRSLLGDSLSLRMDLHPDAGWIRMDSSGLQQVIMNLAVNARDAMTGPGVISIESAPYPPGAGVRLSVRDQGCGMSAETVARVFEPFFTTKDVGKGTGLGLSTVYAIVTNAGGSISVDSEPGKGSAFHVFFPCVPPEQRPVAPQETPSRGETILLVEDEGRVRDLVAGMLQSMGYQVVVASDGADAILKWRSSERSIDLLLSDVRMPGMKGTELAGILRREDPELGVLFISGDASQPDAEGEAGGRVSFLPKPFTRKELGAKLREALEIPRKAARILVVDDSAQIRSLLRATLEAAGYGVDEAGDGHQALAAVRKSPPDVLVTDIVMPETDGIELIREIRRVSRQIRIIAISGAAEGAYLEGAGILGADAIMSKPLVMDTLLGEVRALSRAAARDSPSSPARTGVRLAT